MRDAADPGAGAHIGRISAPEIEARPELLSGEESRHWFAALPAEKRSAIRRLHALRPAWNLIVLLFVAAWVIAALGILQAPSLPIRLACSVVIAITIHSLAILMHEGIHGNLFRNRTLDRWASVILGAPAFFSGTAYRIPHILHHRFNRTEKDPDELTNLTTNRSLLALGFYAWGVIGMPFYLVHVPLTALRHGTPRERRDVLLEYGLLGFLYGGVVLFAARLHALPTLLHCWIIPAGIAGVFGNVRGWAEHTMTLKGHPLRQTRTVKSNRLVSLLMCNLNYHLEHHLFPAMPWYNLPTLHRLLQDEYRRAGAFVYESYVRFLLDAVKIGVHGQTPRRQGQYHGTI